MIDVSRPFCYANANAGISQDAVQDERLVRMEQELRLKLEEELRTKIEQERYATPHPHLSKQRPFPTDSRHC